MDPIFSTSGLAPCIKPNKAPVINTVAHPLLNVLPNALNKKLLKNNSSKVVCNGSKVNETIANTKKAAQFGWNSIGAPKTKDKTKNTPNKPPQIKKLNQNRFQSKRSREVNIDLNDIFCRYLLQPIKVRIPITKGKRMNVDIPKCLVEVAGKPMIHHVLDSIKKYFKG